MGKNKYRSIAREKTTTAFQEILYNLDKGTNLKVAFRI